MMGEVLSQTNRNTAYQPGHWFNSAKFFDIEYQNYGWVWAKAKEDEEQFYWEHHRKKRSVFHLTKEHFFLGINTFGIRMRHEFFDKVLTNKETVDYVIDHLAAANFD
jgi:hypothetical protein